MLLDVLEIVRFVLERMGNIEGRSCPEPLFLTHLSMKCSGEFCDHPMCIVHCPQFLQTSSPAKDNEAWQGCSWDEALPKLFKRLNSSYNTGFHGKENRGQQNL